MSRYIIYLLVVFCAFLGALGQVMFKLSAKDFHLDLRLLKNWKFIIGITLYAVSTLIFVSCLKYGNLSVLYPIIATSYIWVSILSIVILKEAFPPYKWIGITLIIVGISIITLLK